MFCSGCGQALVPGQAFCAQCGRPAAVVMPPVPGLQYQIESYAGKVRTLSIFWFVYAGLSLLLGLAGLVFARAFLAGGLGQWMHGPRPPTFLGPMFLGPVFIHLAWMFLMLRIGLVGAAAWGLMERTPWGRILAIVVAILSLIQFPFGTALGIWTLAALLGYRNSTLYEQL